jgi:NAD(P)-dependent dehydrogenase (short-subunit alcohol dehydrogenase family)
MSHGRFKNPMEATLSGIKDIFGRQVLETHLMDSDRVDGKTCLVTGASTGLGYAIAAQLAERGARVIMISRSGIPEKGDAIRARSKNDRVEMIRCDLSDMSQVNELADRLRGERLDVVVDNAGIATPRAKRTPQGFDAMFATNYVSKFLFLNRLLRDGTIPNASLGKGESVKDPMPRIVIISSDSHRGASAIDWEELGSYYEYGPNKGIENYSYFKLVLNTFATELSRRAPDVSVHVLCPGPVDSEIVREAPAALKAFMKVIFKIFFRDPEIAARPAIYLSASTEIERETNRYLHMFNPKRMDDKCYDRAEGERLWTWTERKLRDLGEWRAD